MADDKSVADIALRMYMGEPCRICGEPIREGELDDLVFAGYSRGDQSRAAHGACWEARGPRETWAFPEDAEGGQPRARLDETAPAAPAATAEHSPTPWRLNHPQLQDRIIDAAGWGVVRALGDTEVATDRANFALILRAVNAVAGPTDGPVDLEAALVHADGIDDGGLHEAADMVRALVGEVVRLRDGDQAERFRIANLLHEAETEIYRVTGRRDSALCQLIRETVAALMKKALFS